MARKTIKKTEFTISPLEPLTENQRKFSQYFQESRVVVANGPAGTGKTHCAIHEAMYDVLDKTSPRKFLMILRSVVPTREVGFLPGSLREKTEPYFDLYAPIFSKIFGRADAMEVQVKKNTVFAESTSFLRGQNIDQAVVMVDEFQNMSFHELDTLITRCGKDTKFIFCGDFDQSDLKKSEGAEEFMDILEGVPNVDFVNYEIEDVVRSGLVKDYLLEKRRLTNPL